MSYPLIRRLLFCLDPERAHDWVLTSLAAVAAFKHSLGRLPVIKQLPKRVLGLQFPNPVGLAAGFDKNGDYLEALAMLGFGFIELGTVTPRPQLGQSKPRLFRLTKHHALINRMGFNNKGVDYLVSRIKNHRYQGILGINIGKNATTMLSQALADYHYCLTQVYPYADYVTVNISSPNTPELRKLQAGKHFEQLLLGLMQLRFQLRDRYQRHVPLVIKVSPDLSDEEINTMAAAIIEYQFDGLIISNTTVTRASLPAERYSTETGGLSGQPLFAQATHVLQRFKQATADHNVALIASGGIMSGEQARQKRAAGADLIQLYTGLIYSGPQLVKECYASFLD